MKMFRNPKLLIIPVGLLLAAALIAASYPPILAHYTWQECKDDKGTLFKCTETPTPKPTEKPTAKPTSPILPTSTPGSNVIPPEFVPPPYDLTLDLPPPTNLRIENGVAACDELPSQREQGACFLSILFGGVPTFVWDWAGNATFNESTLTGYHLTATLISGTGEESALWERDVLPGSRKLSLARTGGLPCGSQVLVTATAVQGSRVSAPSNELIVPTERCITTALVIVTFETIILEPPVGTSTLRDLRELCPGTTRLCEDAYLELFGSLQVNNLIQCWNYWCFPNPPRDGRSYLRGTYMWTREDLQNEGGPVFDLPPPPAPCLRPPCIDAPPATPSPYGHNEFVLPLHNGEGLTIRVGISEKDRAVGDVPWAFTPACGPPMVVLPSRSAAEWARVNETRTLISSDGQGTCRITITIQGQAAP